MTRLCSTGAAVDLALVECWNTFGGLGAAARSSNRKLADADGLAAILGGDDGPFAVGLCWVVRDTAAHRALMNRYRHIFDSRFPGPSAAWARALTRGGPLPREPGLVWSRSPSHAHLRSARVQGGGSAGG
ncbi:hypothetical protein BH24CHL6_BH24CHL6_00820 [soil metagenome]